MISTDGWNDPEIPLPVLAPGTIPMTMDVVDNSGQSTTLTLEPALRFGSLQTVFDGKRSLLVATSNGAPEQLDELLHWLAADRQRAANLNGVALVSVPGRDPVTVLGKQDATARRKADGQSVVAWRRRARIASRWRRVVAVDAPAAP